MSTGAFSPGACLAKLSKLATSVLVRRAWYPILSASERCSSFKGDDASRSA